MSTVGVAFSALNIYMCGKQIHDMVKNSNELYSGLCDAERDVTKALNDMNEYSDTYKTIMTNTENVVKEDLIPFTQQLGSLLKGTVVDKSQTGCPVLHCKIPILRVGVWPIWVGPTHSTLGQSTPYTSSSRHPKMSYFG